MIGRNTALIVIALISVISLSGCLDQGKTQANTVEIKHYNYSHSAFSPDTITVPAGTKVTWINRDSSNHTVTSTKGDFESGNIKPGESYSYTFKEAGGYNYYCKIHRYMKGFVIVK
jgi:plastocyanin